MRRSLTFFWGRHLAVALGAALTTAVLTGALLVGDSVRGSLRDLVLERLGDIDRAVLHTGFFRQTLALDLASELGGETRVAPVLILRGTAVETRTGARASSVQILGVDQRFADLFPAKEELVLDRKSGQSLASVALNESLARELSAGVGDEISLSFERSSQIPRETLLGRRDEWETRATVRLTVSQVLSDRGLGGFGLQAQQIGERNAFVQLRRLQRALGERERVNTLLASSGGDLEEGLGNVLTTDDLGLLFRRTEDEVVVDSQGFFLARALAEGLVNMASRLDAGTRPVLTYLAIGLQAAGSTVPYSTVAALGTEGMKLSDGSEAPAIKDDEILLNQWAAEDLGCERGDMISVRYFQLGSGDELLVAETELRLAGVVQLTGLGADRTLTPFIPGVTDAISIQSWEPPFPVDFAAIGARDHEYWETYRSSPKAFVSIATGQRLWSNRYGELTSIRLGPPSGMTTEELARRIGEELPLILDPGSSGFMLREVRSQGLAAARGSTDFGQLFIGFSFFLIVSAALLLGLLIRLGVEQRAREAGALLAMGYRRRVVASRFLLEQGLVAGVGCLLGAFGALLYAWLMLLGLRSVWLQAVGTPVLFLHAEPLTLLIGFLASLAVVLLTLWQALGRIHRIPAARLLAGITEVERRGRGSRRSALLASAGVFLALAQLAAAVHGDEASPALAFGAGACLVIAGVATAAWRFSPRETRKANALGPGGALVMGIRSGARTPGRSLLCVALVASACFVIVVVAASRSPELPPVTNLTSGAGGFTLLAESDIPLLQDLNRLEDRGELGFTAVYPFRLLPGEDASCLNLYRPARPRVLGVTPAMVERGGFAFSRWSRPGEIPVENPWSLLEQSLEPGVIPAIADEASARWILHLGLGDELVLEDERGRPARLRLVALLRDSIFQGDLLVAEDRLLSAFPSVTGYSYFLVEAPFHNADDVSMDLESRLARFGFDVSSTAQRLADLKAVANTYLSTFQTLGGLGLILGTVGLGVILLRNVLERRLELATLRAYGFRRRTLAVMIVAENAFLLSWGIFIGALSGLVAVAPNLLSGGAQPQWVSLASTLAIVFAVGLLASVGAVLLVARVPLLPVLKEEG